MKYILHTIRRNLVGATCGVLTGLTISACAGAIRLPLVKNWFLNGRIEIDGTEPGLVRRECNGKEKPGELCQVKERLEFRDADGFICTNRSDREALDNYIKRLERAQCDT